MGYLRASKISSVLVLCNYYTKIPSISNFLDPVLDASFKALKKTACRTDTRKTDGIWYDRYHIQIFWIYANHGI